MGFAMGMLNRLTREQLRELCEDDFEAFLDDVVESGFREACKARCWTQSATLNWIRDDEGREGRYERALRVASEMMAHEVVGIADAGGVDEVPRDKLRIDARMRVAGKWDRARYGERDQGGGMGVVPVLNITIMGQAAAIAGEKLVVEQPVFIGGQTEVKNEERFDVGGGEWGAVGQGESGADAVGEDGGGLRGAGICEGESGAVVCAGGGEGGGWERQDELKVGLTVVEK